ncbi:MAG: hypothetical protein SNJ56_06380, partial [Termitinemataceae bacterium]
TSCGAAACPRGAAACPRGAAAKYAALPVPGGLPFDKNIELMAQMIRKNFPGIRELHIFIDGNDIYRIIPSQK